MHLRPQSKKASVQPKTQPEIIEKPGTNNLPLKEEREKEINRSNQGYFKMMLPASNMKTKTLQIHRPPQESEKSLPTRLRGGKKKKSAGRREKEKKEKWKGKGSGGKTNREKDCLRRENRMAKPQHNKKKPQKRGLVPKIQVGKPPHRAQAPTLRPTQK